MKIDRGDGIFFAVLACAVVIVFGSSLFFTEAVMDDVIYVKRIHLLSFSWNNLKLWSDSVIGLWSPLVGYSFMLDYFLWGKEHFFFGVHLVNILLHFIAAAGFYTIARLLKFSRLAALCLNDRTTALRHFENAHKLNPGDENIRKNIEILRKHQPEQH